MNIQTGSGIEEKVIKRQSKTNLIVNLALCRSWYNHGYITYLLPFLDLEKSNLVSSQHQQQNQTFLFSNDFDIMLSF